MLDIQVRLPDDFVPRLEAVHDAIKERYPKRQERRRWHGRFQLENEAVSVEGGSVAVDGYIFRSADDHLAVQARRDGFTLNWLPPYDRWEAFRDEARRSWEVYREIVRPEIVTRLGLRYINKIGVPLPITSFTDWVLTAPEIAPGLPQGLRTFFMRLEVPDETGAVAIITETLEPPEAPTEASAAILPIILDIDAVRESEFPVEGEHVWDTFEHLRDLKNEIFFKSVTDKAKELFE